MFERDKGNIIELTCPICSNKFCVVPSRIKPNLINYCSRRCYDIKQKGNIPWNKNKKISKNWIKTNCIGCRKEFLYNITSSRLGKYCSYKCLYKYRRGEIHPSWKPKIERFCLVCDKKMMLTKQDKRILCSSKCQYKYLSGKNNVNWLNGASFEPYSPTFSRELRELIRLRDGYKCQKCGCPEIESIRKLDIHHIDYDKKNSLPSNLISLCISCNVKANANRAYWTKYFQRKVNKIMSASSMQLHFRFQKKMKLDKSLNVDILGG